MKRLSKRLFLILLLATVCSFAQSNTEKKIDVNTDVDNVRVYKQVVLDGYGTPVIYKELANTYYFRSDYAEAKIWFEKLFESESKTNDTARQRYKQTLKALGLEFDKSPYLVEGSTN